MTAARMKPGPADEGTREKGRAICVDIVDNTVDELLRKIRSVCSHGTWRRRKEFGRGVGLARQATKSN